MESASRDDFPHQLSSSDVPFDSGDEFVVIAEAPEPVALAPAATVSDSSGASRAAVSGSLASIPNGSMPAALLTTLSFAPGITSHVETAAALEAMNRAFRADHGRSLAINNSYRPGFQGRSFHGWGLAVDFASPGGGIQSAGDVQHTWLVANAHRFGFYLPFWAGPSGANPEPWHWEFGSYYSGNAGDCATQCPANRSFLVGHKG